MASMLEMALQGKEAAEQFTKGDIENQQTIIVAAPPQDAYSFFQPTSPWFWGRTTLGIGGILLSGGSYFYVPVDSFEKVMRVAGIIFGIIAVVMSVKAFYENRDGEIWKRRVKANDHQEKLNKQQANLLEEQEDQLEKLRNQSLRQQKYNKELEEQIQQQRNLNLEQATQIRRHEKLNKEQEATIGRQGEQINELNQLSLTQSAQLKKLAQHDKAQSAETVRLQKLYSDMKAQLSMVSTFAKGALELFQNAQINSESVEKYLKHAKDLSEELTRDIQLMAEEREKFAGAIHIQVLEEDIRDRLTSVKHALQQVVPALSEREGKSHDEILELLQTLLKEIHEIGVQYPALATAVSAQLT